ncbi:MAG: hypothetical protein K1X53_06065 [Candidatus Sumerlaeaceae bacterium]|nr:hypothetical protein [Candidatus Sumerlaeaceae bacterium]
MTHQQTADLYDPLGCADPPDELDYSIPGDIVQIFKGEEGIERAVIRTRNPRPDWVCANPDPMAPDAGRVATTIDYRGQFFQISDVQNQGVTTEYILEPWPEGEIHRRVETYSRGAELYRRSYEVGFSQALVKARFLTVFYPIIGMLPRGVLAALVQRIPINIDTAVFWNCILEASVGIFFLFVGRFVRGIANLAGSEGPLGNNVLGVSLWLWVTIAPLLLIDALIRYRMLRRTGQIYGNLLLELIWRFTPGTKN